MKDLSKKEVLEISRGKIGWYYLGSTVGSVDRFLGKLFFINNIVQWTNI